MKEITKEEEFKHRILQINFKDDPRDPDLKEEKDDKEDDNGRRPTGPRGMKENYPHLALEEIDQLLRLVQAIQGLVNIVLSTPLFLFVFLKKIFFLLFSSLLCRHQTNLSSTSPNGYDSYRKEANDKDSGCSQETKKPHRFIQSSPSCC